MEQGLPWVDFVALVSISTFAALSSPVRAQIDFDPAIVYAVVQQPAGDAVAEFDGVLGSDIAITSDDPEMASILLNAGGKTFATTDQDFAPDNASVNSDSRDISVLINRNTGLVFSGDFEPGETSGWSGSVP